MEARCQGSDRLAECVGRHIGQGRRVAVSRSSGERTRDAVAIPHPRIAVFAASDWPQGDDIGAIHLRRWIDARSHQTSSHATERGLPDRTADLSLSRPKPVKHNPTPGILVSHFRCGCRWAAWCLSTTRLNSASSRLRLPRTAQQTALACAAELRGGERYRVDPSALAATLGRFRGWHEARIRHVMFRASMREWTGRPRCPAVQRGIRASRWTTSCSSLTTGNARDHRRGPLRDAVAGHPASGDSRKAVSVARELPGGASEDGARILCAVRRHLHALGRGRAGPAGDRRRPARHPDRQERAGAAGHRRRDPLAWNAQGGRVDQAPAV